jgi:RsiW-degrading membrane proteinase PrsW (M82 family)
MSETTAPPPYAMPPGAVLPPPPKRRWLGLTLLITGMAVVGVVLLTYVGTRIGPTALAVGVIAALVPVPVLVGCFLWLDRYQPEPLHLLVVTFLWGAFVATGVALAVNTGAAWLFKQWQVSDDVVGVLVAPFIEESMKAGFVLLLFILRPWRFTGIVDGIVYCGISAVGFAMVENILYLGGYGYASGAEADGAAGGALAVEAMFIGRVLFTGFAHPLFTAMTGIGIGIAARSPDKRVRVTAPIAGLLVAMMLHGSWNLMATLAKDNQFFLLYGYFAFFMPLFFFMAGVVLWRRSYEGRIAERVLPVYAAAGWFSPPEVAALGTMRRRLSARAWARRVAGEPGLAAMRGYQFAATQLALVRDGMNRGLGNRPGVMAAAIGEEHRLLETVDAHRRVFAGRDPQAPRAHWDGRQYLIVFPDGVQRAVEAPATPVVPLPVPAAAIRPYLGPGPSGYR